MGHMRAAGILGIAGCLVVAGCGGASQSASQTGNGAADAPSAAGGAGTPAPAGTSGTATDATAAPVPSGWPDRLVTAPGTGPALFLGPAQDAPAVGYVSPGVVFRLEGAPQDGRAPVVIEGPLEVHAWLATERTAGRVKERGRVGQAPGYVGPNDVVRVVEAAGSGLLRLELRVPLRDGESLPAMAAVYPAARIGAERVDPDAAQGPSPGTPVTLPAGESVPVYDQPDGRVVATLPALDPPLTVVKLVERDGWSGVRAGTGPYLVGFVQASLTPASEPPERRRDPLAHPSSSDEVPIRLQAEPDRPLHRVAAGTRITFNGEVIGVVKKPALAREMARHDATGEVDVFVAADDGVAVRGMVPASALSGHDGE
ncbi:MAG: hypothetical protein ACODAU_01000 [Myxococcota bacterium]